MKGKQIYYSFPDESERVRQLRRINGIGLNEKPLVDSKVVLLALQLISIPIILFLIGLIAYYGDKYGW